MNKRFFNAYLYQHIREDKNEIFYVGISCDENFERAHHRYGRNHIWKSIVKKTQYRVEIIEENISWESACKKEKELIKQYGRIDKQTGTLSNLTDGGEGNDISQYLDYSKREISGEKNGMFGKKHSESSILKMKEKRKGSTSWNKGLNKNSNESLKIVSEKLKIFKLGKKTGTQSENTKIKKSIALKGKKQKTTTCFNCGKIGSISNIKRWHNENCKLK